MGRTGGITGSSTRPSVTTGPAITPDQPPTGVVRAPSASYLSAIASRRRRSPAVRTQQGDPMTLRRAALAAATGLALATTLVVAPAGAQQPEPEPESLPLDLTPTSGPGGTVITASGADCAPQQAFNAFVQVYFAQGDQVVNSNVHEVSDIGTWSQHIQVPSDVDPAGTYSVFATCFVDLGEDTGRAAEYEAVPFAVSGPAAAPASPVPGDPTFTG